MRMNKSYMLVAAFSLSFSVPLKAYSIPGKIPDQAIQQLSLQQTEIPANIAFTFSEQGISVRIQQATVGAVMREFSRLTGVDVYLSEFRAQQSVSVHFEDLPLDRGLQRILGVNYTLTYASQDGNTNTTLAELIAIRMINNAIAVTPAMGAISLQYSPHKRLKIALQNADENQRLAALKAIQMQGLKNIDPNFLQTIAAADESPKVRRLAQALYSGLAESLNNQNPVTTAINDDAATKDSPPELADATTNQPGESQPLPEEQEATPSNPLELAEQGLQSSDDQTRIDALNSILRQGLDANLDLLQSIATNDSNPQLRQMALEGVINTLMFEPEAAKAFINKVIESEPDPVVKRYAEGSLASYTERISWMLKR